jgi:RNA polymerase sigma-70 factor (ECF subfamily)
MASFFPVLRHKGVKLLRFQNEKRFSSMVVRQPTSQARSSSRFRPWLETHGSKFLLFARQQTRSLADAEDVLQEALVKLARKVEEGSFIGSEDSWPTFLYTQIRREAIDLGRKNDRRRKREENVVKDERSLQRDIEMPFFEQGESQDETRRILAEGLKKLPKKFSEVITMKLWGEQTFAEIGESLGISLNTAASRYRYGIDALRKQLATARVNGDL